MFKDDQDRVDWHKSKIENSKSIQHGIVLHFFENEGIKWQEWHEYIINLWSKVNLVPHMGQASGGPFKNPLRMITYKGTARKLLKFNYEGLTYCDFRVLNDEGLKTKYVSNYISNAYLSAGPGYCKENETNIYDAKIYLLIDDQIKQFPRNKLFELAKKLHYVTNAQYGYYFRYPLECFPESYTGGTDGFSTTIEEYKRNKKWDYNGSSIDYYELCAIKYKYLRDIYKLNFISKRHLDLVYNEEGKTLLDFIKEDPLNAKWELIELSEGFYCWHIERQDLFPEIIQAISKIVICNFTDAHKEEKRLNIIDRYLGLNGTHGDKVRLQKNIKHDIISTKGDGSIEIVEVVRESQTISGLEKKCSEAKLDIASRLKKAGMKERKVTFEVFEPKYAYQRYPELTKEH